MPDVRIATGLSDSHIYNLIAKGAFPKPIKCGRASRWRSDLIASWQQAREAESTGPASSIGQQLAEARARKRSISRYDNAPAVAAEASNSAHG